MKYYIMFVLFLICIVAKAQNKKDVHIEEAVVKAAKVIDKADGKLIIPSQHEKTSSNNAYSLLGKMPLQGIIIDVVTHTVRSADNQGEVQVRINGIKADKAELLALNPKQVKNIDFKDNPGVRYGEGISYVIDIKTYREEEGYSAGVDCTNGLTTRRGDNMAFAGWNRKKSELSIVYDFTYQDFNGTRLKENADYLLNDGSHYMISREDIRRSELNFDHLFELKFNQADSSYVFQAAFTTALNNNPGSSRTLLLKQTGQSDIKISKRNDSNGKSPVLDLYFSGQIGRHQSVTANVVATAIHTRMYDFNNEGSDYAYTVNGRTWSLTSEAVYENRLSPFTLSTGFYHKLKYTDNEYSGDVSSLNSMHSRSMYLFGELAGKWRKFRYTAGLGVSNESYSQGAYRFNFRLFRPKATIGYTFSKAWNLRYNFEISQHISQVAMISNTRIRSNSMEWTVGNPDIEPSNKITNEWMITYTRHRFRYEMTVHNRYFRHPNMAVYSRGADDKFYYTQKNQRSINMMYAANSVHYDLVPDKWKIGVNASVYRFVNKGDTYEHLMTSYDCGFSMQAYLGRWTFTAYAYSGFKFMEGETWNRQSAFDYVTCSYRIGKFDLSLYWQHLFQAHPRMNCAEVVNENIHKQMTLRGSDYGNMVSVGFGWKFNRGKTPHYVDRRINNKDTQTGILQ